MCIEWDTRPAESESVCWPPSTPRPRPLPPAPAPAAGGARADPRISTAALRAERPSASHIRPFTHTATHRNCRGTWDPLVPCPFCHNLPRLSPQNLYRILRNFEGRHNTPQRRVACRDGGGWAGGELQREGDEHQPDSSHRSPIQQRSGSARGRRDLPPHRIQATSFVAADTRPGGTKEMTQPCLLHPRAISLVAMWTG